MYYVLACDNSFLMYVMLSPLPVYNFVSSLTNPVTDEKEKAEAKAKATAGKCHEYYLS